LAGIAGGAVEVALAGGRARRPDAGVAGRAGTGDHRGTRGTRARAGGRSDGGRPIQTTGGAARGARRPVGAAPDAVARAIQPAGRGGGRHASRVRSSRRHVRAGAGRAALTRAAHAGGFVAASAIDAIARGAIRAAVCGRAGRAVGLLLAIAIDAAIGRGAIGGGRGHRAADLARHRRRITDEAAAGASRRRAA